MGLLSTSEFQKSLAGQVLRRIAEADPGGAPPDKLGFGRAESNALLELERMGLVRLVRGTGAMAWQIERVVITESGRAKAEES